jgi:hypothetical protein
MAAGRGFISQRFVFEIVHRPIVHHLLFSVVETLQGQLKNLRKIWITDKLKKILNLCKKKKD